MTAREQAIHAARAYLTESRKRRGQSFGWVLLTWAGNARMRAAAMREPAQREMFG